jgi:flagellar L-ring protein precursor FlgH
MVSKNTLILWIVIFFLAGCASRPNSSPVYKAEMKKVQEPTFPAYRTPQVEEGSLWSEERGMSLYSDFRARRVGDTVTIRIVEDPQASLEANTKTSRASSVDAKLKFLGYMQYLAEKNSRLAQNPGGEALISSSFDTAFDGKGTSDREGHVSAYITAMVVKVLPNGNLYISGKREIKVNNELQYITISGIIRPEDVTTSNEVASTFVADARVAYSGVGPVSDKQVPGWLGRILDHVWPF